MSPQVTIVMPHFNDGERLPCAIESILSQTFTNFELLIIDDASTDESIDILHEYLKQDKRIRVIFNAANKGSIPRFHEGAFLAKSPYIHDMGADDIRYPTFLEEGLNLLQNNPDLGACFTQFHWGDEKNKHLEKCGIDNTTLYLEPNDAVQRILEDQLKLSAVSAIYRRDLARQYGSYDPSLTYMADWYLMHQIIFNHPTVVIPKPLCFFRVHDNNYSNVARHNKKCKLATYKRLLQKLECERELRKKFRKSALLMPIFADLFWQMLFNPRYLFY